MDYTLSVIEFIIFQVNFEFDEKFVFEKDSIGSFTCNINDDVGMNRRKVHANDISLIDIVETGKAEYIKLDCSPYRLVELKNKNILVGSLDEELLALYDSEFKLIRRITEINNEKVKPYGLVCDQDGNVFVTNGCDRSLYKLDSELGLIKWIKGSNHGCFGDITIHRNKIYMCGDKCIRVYSLNLVMITDHYVEDMPVQIRITTDRACVLFKKRTENDKSTWITRFYKLPSFALVNEHNLAGPILVHDSMFFLYQQNGTGFTLFEKNGKIMKKLEKPLGKIKYFDSGMRFFTDALYICMKDNKICKMFIESK
jgi:hypothetical protein